MDNIIDSIADPFLEYASGAKAPKRTTARPSWLLQVSGCRGFGLCARRVRYTKAVNYIAVVGNVELRVILFT